MNRTTAAKKLLSFCAALLLVCGCGPSAQNEPASGSSEPVSPPPSSAPQEEAAPEPSWADYTLADMTGEAVDLLSEEVTSIQTGYAIAWEPGRDGYVRLEGTLNGHESWGDAHIDGGQSTYRLLHQEDGSITPQCLDSSYSFDCEAPVPGILQADGSGLLFFPYKGADLPFLRLEQRDEGWEKTLLEHAALSRSDGTAVEIWPAAVGFEEDAEAALLELLGLGKPTALTQPRWYDVELGFADVVVRSYPDDPYRSLPYGFLGELPGAPAAVSTRYTGRFGLYDPRPAAQQFQEDHLLTVKGELSLSGPVWPGYAPWVFPDYLPEPPNPPAPAWTLSEDGELLDLTGAPVGPWTGEPFLLGLSYACGWDLEREGYLRLDDGRPNGGLDSLEAYSVYYIYSQYTGSKKLGLSRNAFRFSPASPVPGILQVDRYAVLFFPYKSVPEPFLRVEPRDRDQEKTFREVTVLSRGDGTTLEIKPLAVQFWDEDREALLGLLDIGDRDRLETPRWFDVQIDFSSVEVASWSDNPWEALSTRVRGELAEGAPLLVEKELSLTQRVWTGFAYWYFPDPDWEE